MCVYTSMTQAVYSVAHTHTTPIQELAERYGFNMYTHRLNSYVYLWCIVLDSDSPYATHILVTYANQLTYMYNV